MNTFEFIRVPISLTQSAMHYNFTPFCGDVVERVDFFLNMYYFERKKVKNVLITCKLPESTLKLLQDFLMLCSLDEE